MENTLENKAKFFALYYNQKVLKVTQNRLDVVSKSWNWEHSNFYLELTPLSQITNEDAIEVSRLCLDPKEKPLEVVEIINWDWLKKIVVNREPSLTDKDTIVEMYISFNFEDTEVKFTWDYNNSKGSGQLERHLPNAMRAYDLLRYKGYAVPWMGLSVEQLVSFGWAKLKETNQ